MAFSLRGIFLVVVIFVLAPLTLRGAEDGDEQQRPNILFLFSDDQRADAIGAYDNPHIRTPNLDRLAEQGFNFRRAYCMGSIHGAVCQPSRAMLNSGRTLYHVPMDLKNVPILPDVLRQAGYTTFGTGKWHNGEESFARGFSLGNAVFFGGMWDHSKVPLIDLSRDGTYTNKRNGDRFSSTVFADAVIDFLRGHDGATPFYAYVAFTAPHDPRMPPQEYRDAYAPGDVPLPANFMPQHPFNNGWLVGRDEQLAPWPRTPEVIESQLAEYYGLISHLDAQIGRILAALDETGHGADTLVVFSSDHGLAIGSHGLLGKQSLYEHSMRTPLIFAGLDVPAGETDALVYLYDVMPTLLDVAGVPLPEAVEGQDLVPIWRGERATIRDTLFTTYEDIQRAVRDGRWKLIRYPKIDHTQLFDLEADPNELNNLAESGRYADEVARLTRELQQWQQRTDDTQPLVVEDVEAAEIDLTGHERTPDRHQPAWIVEKYFQGK
ncbi:MAG: sulfatase-like hydrolase/transferase [Pirellulales bacterium]